MTNLMNAKEARIISDSVIAGESEEQIKHEMELLEKLIDKALPPRRAHCENT